MSIVVSHTFTIPSPLKIPSVNFMYKPASAKGRSSAWLYKDEVVKEFQEFLIENSKSGQLGGLSNSLKEICYIDVVYIFLLDENFLKRDVSNCIKFTEDALVKVTGIDDSRHRKVSAIKALSYIPDTEYIICKYEIFYNENK